MNQIVNLNATATLTMSSREIAELTGKRHDNVIADTRKMLTSLRFQASDFEGSYIDPTGRTLPCFNLPKRETLILVSGYSVELRARIIDRWMELEAAPASKTSMALPQNFGEALRLAADEYEKRVAAEAKVEQLTGPALVVDEGERLKRRVERLTAWSVKAREYAASAA